MCTSCWELRGCRMCSVAMVWTTAESASLDVRSTKIGSRDTRLGQSARVSIIVKTGGKVARDQMSAEGRAPCGSGNAAHLRSFRVGFRRVDWASHLVQPHPGEGRFPVVPTIRPTYRPWSGDWRVNWGPWLFEAIRACRNACSDWRQCRGTGDHRPGSYG